MHHGYLPTRHYGLCSNNQVMQFRQTEIVFIMHKSIMLVLTLMLSGRAMTLAFIHRAGQGGPGDPPAAWLMPLIGDAVIGLSALVVAYLIWNKRGLWVWTCVIVWNVVAKWDALSAFVIYTTNPWPDFFMLQLVGPVMFFAASAMHLILLYLMSRKPVCDYYLQKTEQ